MKPTARMIRLLLCALIPILVQGCLGLGETYKGKTYTLKRGPLVNQVEASGVLKSAEGVYVSVPKVEGVHEFTVSFLAPEGSQVQAGTPIVGFDVKRLREDMNIVSGKLASEKKMLEKIRLEEKENLENLILERESAKVEVARAWRKADVPERYSSRLDVEKARRDHQLAVAKEKMAVSKVAQQRTSMERKIAAQERLIQRLEAETAQYKTSIEEMTVKAPTDGLVVYEENWNGDKPAVGDRMWVGRSIMQLPDLNRMNVAAEVDEPDAGRVHVDQVAEVRLDANPDRLFTGKVTHLGRVFHTKSRQKPSVVFDATITLDAPDTEIMRPGMTAKVRLVVDRADDVLLLSEKAVLFDAEQPYVLLVTSGKTRRRMVTLGGSAGGFVAVTDGLAEGDTVALLNGEEEGS